MLVDSSAFFGDLIRRMEPVHGCVAFFVSPNHCVVGRVGINRYSIFLRHDMPAVCRSGAEAFLGDHSKVFGNALNDRMIRFDNRGVGVIYMALPEETDSDI